MAVNKLICPKCMAVHFVEDESTGSCPHCHLTEDRVYNFRNSDEFLEKEVPRVIEERKDLGLSGLFGGLGFVIINTEPFGQQKAVEEFLRYTGYTFSDGFEDDSYRTCVLEAPGSAAVLIRHVHRERPLIQATIPLPEREICPIPAWSHSSSPHPTWRSTCRSRVPGE